MGCKIILDYDPQSACASTPIFELRISGKIGLIRSFKFMVVLVKSGTRKTADNMVSFYVAVKPEQCPTDTAAGHEIMW